MKSFPGTYVVIICMFLAGLVPGNLYSQNNTNITDSRTPAGVAVGAPDGVYALGNLETFNPYNGSLNIHIPLYRVGGRGEAGYDIAAVIQRIGA